jgi:hypothetical protein
MVKGSILSSQTHPDKTEFFSYQNSTRFLKNMEKIRATINKNMAVAIVTAAA